MNRAGECGSSRRASGVGRGRTQNSAARTSQVQRVLAIIKVPWGTIFTRWNMHSAVCHGLGVEPFGEPY